MPLSNAELFIEKYKKLESAVRTSYQLENSDSISWFLRNQKEYREAAEQIRYCQEVRNLLQHQYRISDEYPVQPGDKMLEFLDQLIARVQKRKRCMDIAVPYEKIFWRDPDANVRQTIEQLKEKSYTQVPILDRRVVVGVLDAASILRYLADQGKGGIPADLRFRDIYPYLALDKKKTEVFSFQKSSLYVDELQDVFEEQYRRGRRIATAFLTKNGDCREPVLGMITPWDILGKE